MIRALFAVLVLAAPAAVGCGGPRPREASPSGDPAHIEALVRDKCSACHKRPEPARLPRANAEVEVQKHRTRLELSESDWLGVVEYSTKKR